MKRKFIAIMLTGALVLGTVLTGCGSSASNNAAKPATEDTATTKTLVYSQGADPRGLDPAYVDDGESAKVISNVYEGLIKYKDGSTEIEPCLALDWEISEDGKEYTFNLRQDVKFQDGTPFNADAVIFNVERQLPPKATDDMPYASFTYGQVAKIEKTGDYSVKFTLTSKYTPFLANLAMSLAAPVVSPTAVAKFGDKFIENPVGTGPYSFVSWDKNQSLKLTKFDGYWGDKPKVDNVVFKFTKENSVRASDLMTGGTDIIDGVDPNDIEKLKSEGMEIYQSDGMNINYMAFNCSREPFNDPALREAISHAIDREELVKYLYQGYSSVANSPLPTFIPGYDKDVEPYNYDADKAKQMLKDAGKSDLEVKIITYSNPRPYNTVGGQKLAESVQNYLAKIGVTATIDSYNWTDYKGKLANGEGDIFFYGWTGDNGDADNFLSLFDSNEIKSTLNSAQYSNPAVDALLLKGRELENGEERNKIYKELQEIVAKDAPWLPISHSQALAAYSPNVTGFSMHPTGSVFFSGVDK
ncbi:ABC transporter substrate-binding protein [Clostridium sp.]|uniref:ABC transporter substrate-binding protein n=1 Tax=Clostridium sp. TaxID=1506 RepID=UPI001A4376F2|nr:ABC transporter substrate-binding protein [Clostridium sp.]MBK5241314.1 ABC transporter substrate-binding protein [Clostridium sp.]